MATADYSAELTRVEAQLEKAESRLDEMLSCVQMTYTVDGETFKATEYQEMLLRMIKNLRARRDVLCRILNGEGFTSTQVFA